MQCKKCVTHHRSVVIEPDLKIADSDDSFVNNSRGNGNLRLRDVISRDGDLRLHDSRKLSVFPTVGWFLGTLE